MEGMEDDTMLILAENALEVLKVKENCFDFVATSPMYWNIVRSHNKLLAIYYAEDMSKLDEFKGEIEKLLGNGSIESVSVYIFSFVIGQFNDFFDNNNQITVKDFPEPMLRVLSGGKKKIN